MVETNGRRDYRPVHRFIALQPGRYRLDYSVRGAPVSSQAWRIGIYCSGAVQPLATSSSSPLQGSGFDQREIGFTAPSSCPLLLVAFESSQTGDVAGAEFAKLWLQRD